MIRTLLLISLSSVHCLAQNFAVLLAKDDPASPVDHPTNWPVQVQPIGSATNLPARYPPPWRFATKSQVDKWMSDHAAEKDAWNQAQEAAATQPKRDREAAIKQAIIDLKSIRDSTGSLTAAQLSNAVRVIARALLALIEHETAE